MSGCALRKLTIALTGHPNLVLNETIGGKRLSIRSMDNRTLVGDRTLAGSHQLVGNLNYKPVGYWIVEAALDFDKKAIFDDYITALQNDPSIVFVLQDEAELLPVAQGSWNSRTIVPDTTRTATSGLQQAYYAFNTRMRLLEKQVYEQVGADLWETKGLVFEEIAVKL